MPPLADKTKINTNGKIEKPRLVNRGAAGLLNRLPLGASVTNGDGEIVTDSYSDLLPKGIGVVKDKISSGLITLVVPIDSLVPDPKNARIHNDRNMQVIRASLCMHGQTQPVVVRKQTRVVVAGNGRLQAAKELGWTKIAANIMDMTEEEAAAYALTDNRSAELASWDFEVIAELEKLASEGGYQAQGWNTHELLVLRTTEDWSEYTAGEEEVPPEILDEDQEQDEDDPDAEADASLLARLQVTIAEPTTQVNSGEVYRVGQHLLVIADPVKEVPLWRLLLTNEMLFCPYPGLLIPLSKLARTQVMLLVQPDHYLAGHLLDHYKSIYGEEEVQLVQ